MGRRSSYVPKSRMRATNSTVAVTSGGFPFNSPPGSRLTIPSVLPYGKVGSSPTPFSVEGTNTIRDENNSFEGDVDLLTPVDCVEFERKLRAQRTLLDGVTARVAMVKQRLVNVGGASNG